LSANALVTLIRHIDNALPQTQCTRCGYPDCAAYARAIATDQADINQCPPGGTEGIKRLSAITGRPVRPLNQVHGQEAARFVAVIDEHWCIGCTLCLKACPVDAIVGIPKHMHTVIATHCTGCELCVPSCPVDCIQMHNASAQATGWAAWSTRQAENARGRYQARQGRLHKGTELTGDLPSSKQQVPPTKQQNNRHDASQEAKRAAIALALARAKSVVTATSGK